MIWLLLGTIASGQDVFSADIERFRPAQDARGYGVTESAATLGHLEMGVGLWLNFQENSLVMVRDGQRVLGGPRYEDALLYRRNGADLQLGFGLFDRMSINVGLPVVLWQKGVALQHIVDPSVSPDLLSSSIADARAQIKVTALEPGDDPIGLAFGVVGTVPTGPSISLIGEGGFTVMPQLMLEYADGSVRDKEYTFRTAINGGYRIRRAETFRQVTLGNEFLYAAGFGVRPIKWVEVGAEVHGGWGGSLFAHRPLEVSPLVWVHPARDITLTAGGALGLLPGLGTPDYRLFVGGTISPSFDPRVRDRDGDGIPDKLDKCPNVPEDFDGFEDEDGCPDYDNDQDGILDVDDLCPNDPETYNGYQDEDGCPDVAPDRDGDGIPDHIDQCPDEPEDFDGFEDEDGCPDYDNDQDGILDVDDACPNDPETYNNYMDEDGCPDIAPAKVEVQRAQIVILEQIFFDFDQATIRPESYALLDEIAATFEAHPEILRVRVEGHTDNQGTGAYNMDLSVRRAQAVVASLVQRGVDARRLESQGFGMTRPIATNTTEDGQARNRRVEFHILKRD